jgi:adenosylhomocysteine nucleosidase
MIAVAFALEFEGAYFRSKHDKRLRLSIWQFGAMGAAAAQVAERKLETAKPDLLVSAGFAGALHPDLAIGDLVIGSNYSDPNLLERLTLSSRWRLGELVTVPAILEREADKQEVSQRSGAMMADMETAHLADLCESRGIPLLSVRCISDALAYDMPVPSAVLLNPATGRPEPLQLFRFLISNPMAVTGFNTLVKNARAAQVGLATGLEEILPQLLRIA